MVTVTVDGREVAVKPGTNMIEAARQVGSDIPYYCYHPRLSIAANCRMCLVEVSNAPKLVPACQTALSEGLVIKTTTPKVQEQQRAVMEFLLLNHPVDCAICDQAGECKLQDYYMTFNAQPSRLEGGKVMKDKRKELGPLVTLDQERCILCSRCVRFMDEVPKEPQLGIFGRGSHEVVDTFPGQQLDSNYSGNIVDICPVGALTNRDFRFRARAWFLSAAPSVCTGCSRGCSIFADHYGQDTHRYRPRENEAINKSWMCDQGRLSYKYLAKGRVPVARVGRGADLREVTREEAVAAAADLLRTHARQKGLAVLASPLASNEDLLAALSFAKDVLGVSKVYVGGRPQGQADHYLMTADKNPNRKGLAWVAAGLGLTLASFEELEQAIAKRQVSALYAVGAEVPGDVEAFATKAEALEAFVVQATNESPLLAAAHVVLPAAVHVEDEGTFTQADGITQRFRKAYPPRNEAAPHWKWAAELQRALGTEAAYTSAREVFRALAPKVPELASFAWDKEAPTNREKSGINPIPTGADGRPPGYRESGIPRVRGI
ncbi:MAG: 2Fe-2S iron-sulfur cluster-binding protein [Myxococcaceae bacterium]|nr:2Fe-2S iron-sulfur cluster-binding protein [Myxococcaceae bacterium]MCI0673890.1 2Fe-2S iron-sulfur cluster-binding protein [Myxococcaceae bacterium]